MTLEELKQSNIETVKTIKKGGNKVEVYHGRLFNTPTGTVVLNNQEAKEAIAKGEQLELNNHGGFTLVEIQLKNGKTFTGKETVKSGNQFNRKLGFHRAVAVALRNLTNGIK